MIYRILKDLGGFLRSEKLWVGLLIGSAGFFLEISNLIKIVGGSEYGVCIFEPYALGCTSSRTLTISAAGLVFALSDMPYLSKFELSCVYRTTKAKRITEKFAYSAVCTLVYFIIQFALILLLSTFIGYAENIWSYFAYGLKDSVKIAFSPASAAFVSLLLSCAYSLMIISLLFFLSLFLQKGAAFAVIFAFQAVQHFMMSKVHAFSYFCLFRNSILNYYEGADGRMFVNLGIEMIVISAALIGSLLIRDKITFDVRSEET